MSHSGDPPCSDFISSSHSLKGKSWTSQAIPFLLLVLTLFFLLLSFSCVSYFQFSDWCTDSLMSLCLHACCFLDLDRSLSLCLLGQLQELAKMPTPSERHFLMFLHSLQRCGFSHQPLNSHPWIPGQSSSIALSSPHSNHVFADWSLPPCRMLPELGFPLHVLRA